jgi:hypothetical protein
MCIFSAPVRTVANTVLIASELNNGYYRIIYSNKVATDNANIMVLPIDGTDVKLVKLEDKYKTLAQSVVNGVQDMENAGKMSLRNYSATNGIMWKGKIPIIKYGPYDVSIVQGYSYLHNVDWDKFGGLAHSYEFFKLMSDKYYKHTFIIAKIRDNEIKSNDINYIVHDMQFAMERKNEEANIESKIPICYDFKPNNSISMLPTFHIHNGMAEEIPDWDHYIVIVNGKLYNAPKKLISKEYNVNLDKIKSYFNMVYELLGTTKYEFNPVEYINIYRIDNVNNTLSNEYLPNADLDFQFDKISNSIFIKSNNNNIYNNNHINQKSNIIGVPYSYVIGAIIVVILIYYFTKK